MRHYAILITMAAVALLAGCQEKETEQEKFDSRTASPLEVTYTIDGVPVTAISLSHGFSRQEIQVTMNNPGLRWDVESAPDWCKVVPEEHRGNGSFTIEIEANENFTPRSANLTFKAGDFRGFRIQVDQSASTFNLNRPFIVLGQSGDKTLSVEVSTPEGLDWTLDTQEDWISVTRMPALAPAGGQVSTTLNLSVGKNFDVSRLGTVNLAAGNEKAVIYVWQFGMELHWEDDKVCFHNDEPASFSMAVPRSMIRDIVVQDFVSVEKEKVNDEYDRLSFTLEDNVSDLDYPREVLISFILSDNASSRLDLPLMNQDFTPAGGLVSGEGMELLAKKVAEGASTAYLENAEGWITMLQDIDMSKVKNWQGIGTPLKPFSGKFDGNGKSLVMFSSDSLGVFGYCKGKSEDSPAVIRNLFIDKKSSITVNDETAIAGGRYLGCFVGNAVSDVRIESCVSEATVKVSDTGANDVWIGGILGKGGARVSVENCAMDGKGRIEINALNGTEAYIGGIAGEALSVKNCKMHGSITDVSSVSSLYIAGITTKIYAGSTVSGNNFGGSVSVMGDNAATYAGGLYSALATDMETVFDKSTDKSSSSGAINIEGYMSDESTTVYAGGFLGYAPGASELTFKGYEIQSKVFIDQSFDKTAAYVCAGEVLGGTDPVSKVVMVKFDNVTTQGSLSFKFSAGEKPKSGILRGFYGGAAGFIFGPAAFTGCANTGQIGSVVAGSYIYSRAKNDVSANFLGGLAGYIEGGNASFSDCSNAAEGVILNPFWTNQSASDGDENYLDHFRGVFCGGILGAFDMHRSGGTSSLTVSGCSNKASMDALRGLVGGIVGFCQNATITGCERSGKEYTAYANQVGCHQGGIVGGMMKGTVSNCTVRTSIHAGSPGSSDFASPGGIIGRVFTGQAVTVSDCKYFGSVSAIPSNGTILYPGGIVGAGCANTKVVNCKFGGNIIRKDKNNSSNSEAWESNVEITEKNVAQYVYGNKTGEVEGIDVWDGNK